MKKFIDICQSCLVLFGMMLCGLFVDALCGSLPIGAPDSFARQWVIFAGQNIFAFIIPAILTWKICFKGNPLKRIGVLSVPSGRLILIALVIYAVAVPALNQIVFWNEEIHLPEFLSSYEEWCVNMEKQAEMQINALLETDILWQMLMNIFVIGVLTGIGEEFFFRGGLQKLLIHCRVNHHVAIWTAAFVFSAIHFQFYGFVPRLILGAWFGYLYLWSGNIWIPALAHAVNNSIVIISDWCIRQGIVYENFDMLGVSQDSFPFVALISAILTGLAIYACHRCGWLSHRPDVPSNIISNGSENN